MPRSTLSRRLAKLRSELQEKLESSSDESMFAAYHGQLVMKLERMADTDTDVRAVLPVEQDSVAGLLVRCVYADEDEAWAELLSRLERMQAVGDAAHVNIVGFYGLIFDPAWPTDPPEMHDDIKEVS